MDYPDLRVRTNSQQSKAIRIRITRLADDTKIFTKQVRLPGGSSEQKTFQDVFTQTGKFEVHVEVKDGTKAKETWNLEDAETKRHITVGHDGEIRMGKLG